MAGRPYDPWNPGIRSPEVWLEERRKSIRTAADVAVVVGVLASLLIGAWQIRGSRIALELSQRPLVLSTGEAHWLTGTPASGTRPAATLTFKNMGHGPAVELVITAAAFIAQDLETARLLETSAITPLIRIGIIGAGAETVIRAVLTEAISVRNMNDLWNRQKKFFIVGRLVYKDIFGNVWPQTYCTRWLPPQGGAFDPGTGDWVNCDEPG